MLVSVHLCKRLPFFQISQVHVGSDSSLLLCFFWCSGHVSSNILGQVKPAIWVNFLGKTTAYALRSEWGGVLLPENS